MAEAMNSHEIEDVLSSIRRLVAQDLKPADRAKLAAVADISQKLVLAPENRVEDPVGMRAEPGPAEDSPAKFVTVRRPSRRTAFPAIDDVLNRVDGGAPSYDFGPQGAHFALGDTQAPESVSYSAPEMDPAHADLPDDSFAATDVASGAMAGEFIAPQRDLSSFDLDARLSDLAPEQFSDGLSGEYHDAPPDLGGAAEPQSDWSQTDEPEEYDDLTPPQDAAQSDAVQGTIEPDSDWADAAEARVIAELAGEAVEDAVVSHAKTSFREPNFGTQSGFGAQASAVPDVVFDEDALRLLVQTVFREEMAGPMGERITRNIRKLVRAEVGRMLAAHELE